MRIFSWSLIFVLSLLLSACGQKGPLTMPQDEPPETQTETQAEEQASPEDQASKDNGADDDGEQ